MPIPAKTSAHGPKSPAALVACGLLLSFPLLATAQESAAPQTGTPEAATSENGTTETPDPRTSAALRLIHLESGQILRAKARWNGESWELKRGRDWQPLDPRAVLRVERERDLLRQARSREREIPKAAAEGAKGRVQLAEWLAGEGLYAEAVEHLNRVLLVDPDQAQALELLARNEIPFVLPNLDVPEDERAAALEEALRFGAKASPVGRELVIQALEREEYRSLLRLELRKQLFSNSPNRRSFATHGLRRIFPGEHLREIVHRAVLDPSDKVRRGASLALSQTGEPTVIAPVLRALSSSHPRVRLNAAEALGNMGFAAAVEPLMASLTAPRPAQRGGGAFPAPGSHIFVGKQTAYIQDFDVEVAQFQAVADPQVNVLIEGAVLDARIQGVTAKAFVTERATIRRSLAQLTGASPGHNTRAWAKWWADNKDRWLAKNHWGKRDPSGEPRTSTR